MTRLQYYPVFGRVMCDGFTLTLENIFRSRRAAILGMIQGMDDALASAMLQGNETICKVRSGAP